jgi:multiple sugar transport system substrate-binding protein
MSQEPKKVERRSFLGYAVAIAATAVVVGAGTYLLTSGGGATSTVTSTVPTTVTTTVPTTVTSTVTSGTTTTQTSTATSTTTQTSTSTATSTVQQWKQFPNVKIAIAVGAGGQQAFSGICYHYRPIIKALTQLDAEVVELAYSDLPVKVLADLTTKANAYDTFIPCSNLMGDLVAPGYVAEIDTWYGKAGYPVWNKADNPANNAQCSVWGGKYYGVPWDNDAWYLTWNMKGMDATLRNSAKRAEFKSKYGYDLNPYAWERDRKISWKKVTDMSEFFNGWDWNADGSPDWGMTMGLRTGEQGSFWWYGYSAPWVVEYGATRDATHNLFFLDPETMAPLMTSKHPGFLAAAKSFKNLVKFMNPAVFTYTFAETWDEHLAKGNSMFLFQAPDTISLAGDPTKSSIRGYLMTTVTPGSDEYYSLASKTMVSKYNQVGNVCGCSWHPFINKSAKSGDGAYFFDAYVAQPKEHFFTSASAYTWTGCDPGAFTTDILTDYGGVGTLADFNLPPTGSPDPGPMTEKPFEQQAKFNEGDLRRGQLGIWNNLNAPDAFEDYLKIPGATAMFTSVDTHIIGEMLTGAATEEVALDRVNNDWTKIIADYGLDKLKTMYQAMIGYKGANPYSPKKNKFDPNWIAKDVIF